jgi:serine/threonine-protein kinase
VLDGFEHLEKHDVLHRDIRPQNILVTLDGIAKIIDFGFGKRVGASTDFEKSISLNWWCEPPLEFKDAVYDYKTEVYFVGKLFEKILRQSEIGGFQYGVALAHMCASDPALRIESFSKVRQEVLAGKLRDMSFTDDELGSYRAFARSLSTAVSKIERGAKYFAVAEVERKLDSLYRSVMLEEILPSNSGLVGCFVNGSYFFSRRNTVEVDVVRSFVDLLRSCARDKKEVVISNIHTRLDAVQRYDDQADLDIPF